MIMASLYFLATAFAFSQDKYLASRLAGILRLRSSSKSLASTTNFNPALSSNSFLLGDADARTIFRDLYILPCRITRCPGPVKVVSAKLSGHINHLTNKVETRNLLCLHCL